jgi:hypothetical protein
MQSGTDEREGNIKHDVTQRKKNVLRAKAMLNEKPTGKNKE